MTTGNSDEPLTRLQGRAQPLVDRSGLASEPATTVQPGRHRPGVSREDGGRADTAQPHASHRPPSLNDPGNLGDLQRRFRLEPDDRTQALLGAGAEANVWRAWDNEGGRIVALKVYHHSDTANTFDTALRERLHNPVWGAYVPSLFGWGLTEDGYGRQVAWEAMEYFERGSLADLLRTEVTHGGGLPPERARELLRALVDALEFWEDVIHQRQVDLSPGNVLVRSAQPVQLVLSDFGGVRGTGLSQAIADLQVKIGYMAPEALGGGNHARSPYWSLGMICSELIAGRSIVAGRDEAALRVILATTEIDLGVIQDARWRLLISGLLTRDPEDRWGPAHVREWLDGGSPPVARLDRRPSPEPTRAIPPITFAEQEFLEPAELVRAMTTDHERAADWLQTGGAALLRRWFVSFFADRAYDLPHLAVSTGDLATARVSLAELGVVIAPTAPPSYRGRRLDEAGLLRLAQDPASRSLLREVVEHDVLAIAAGYACGHPGCTTASACHVFRHLNAAIPAATAAAMERLGRLGQRLRLDAMAVQCFGGTELVGSEDVERLMARATEVLLSQEIAREVKAALRRRRLPRADWWNEIGANALAADHTIASGAAALIVADEVLDRAAVYRRAEDHLRREESRQRRTGAAQWLAAQFTRNPAGRGLAFWTPGWLSGALVVLAALSAVEPAYFWIARPEQLPWDTTIVSASRATKAILEPYTQWAPDWFTPLLIHRLPDPGQAAFAYTTLLVLALVLIRRTRRPPAARSWIGALGAALGVVVAVGFVCHLLASNFQPLWAGVATMGIWVVIWPIAALVAVRILAGRS